MKKLYEILSFVAFVISYFAGLCLITYACGDYVADAMVYDLMFTIIFPFIFMYIMCLIAEHN